MNNELKEAMQIISKVFPVSYAYTDSAYENVHSATTGIKRVLCKNDPDHEFLMGENLNVELEMAQIERDEENVVDVIKLSSSCAGSPRKFSLFIDISELKIKTQQRDSKPEKLLCNSKYIVSYMRLSEREKEILKHLAQMRTSDEIANYMFISPNTVKSHRKNIKKKIDLSSRESFSRFLNWVRELEVS